ncbi:leucine zipper putative tumor suppressor 3 isoform X2 [Triplophysa rosa]|uniref:Leucine zipper putative tumor suppressor 3 n=2 Tax=Triplophysa rosa TaxID=992332 RepID=A0A9W8CAD8_TRIRA|nr:leucine zipper putative tumor suppressor 3 isoform X2 [Triplophysa rosa]XP_057175768.1 leucine zipper putative tumor suppressor 3 isoform X2 [Triplophysa rosa]XP_057175776.1 leucine zipper putative tumor suppressor 3 isoform X2 [Triplophysa rosa]XP_057175783.1 leucine zipper putative tumor suppressor 3 isoform X2 [Triplophysa rosa]KAI7813431.1 putative leucine zipper putative tumor suppressor 3 [Triplophysa rosa]
MGSVGSGASSQRPITMRSVGTRTTPNGPLTAPPPPNSARRRLDDRSFSADRIPGPSTKAKGVSADERSYNAERDYHGNARGHSDAERPAAHNVNRQQTVNGERLVSNTAFFNGGVRREGHRRGESLDLCGNNIVLTANEKNVSHQPPAQHNDKSKAKPYHQNPPNILPVSGKLEHAQTNDSLVRPSAFKPVVPKNFHSMQNLVCPLQTSSGTSGGPGSSGSGGSGGEKSAQNPSGGQWDQDSPSSRGTHAGAGRAGQGSLSDSGRNSLTSLPTYTGSGYGPPPALGPLSASTSHINRLGTVALDKLDKPGYQNGISASDSGRSSSGKSSSSYQRLSHLSDAPGALRPSPSSDDLIQDLEDRLWEREQEVIHMRRNLDQSEAAIVQVFEEKQHVWEREMEELRQNYAGRLQQVTRRAQRTQQALQAQISRLQQDKRRLQDEMTLLLAQREELEKKCLDFRKEQADILPRLEETKWEVCQKAGEISLLKQQLRESQGEVTQRAGEMVALRGQLKDLNAQLRQREEAEISLKESFCTKTLELERCEAELQTMLAEVTVLRDKLSVFETEVTRLKKALGELSSGGRAAEPSLGEVGQMVTSRSRERLLSPLSPPETPASLPALPAPDPLLTMLSDDSKVQRQESGDLRRQLDRLQSELRVERQQRERQALTFAQERQTWQDEKERVLKYQAQLQLSYVEMLQKNQALEERVEKLTPPPPATSASPPPAVSQDVPTPVSVSISLTSPTPPVEDKALPELHQLAPPWPVPTRLERIESTEI